MDTPPVTLGPAEQPQLYVLTELLAGRLTAIEAALSLDISIRHLKRQKARVAAAKRGSSVSRLLAEQIDVLSRQDDDYDRAMHDALAELERGCDLGGGPYPARDEVHDR